LELPPVLLSFTTERHERPQVLAGHHGQLRPQGSDWCSRRGLRLQQLGNHLRQGRQLHHRLHRRRRPSTLHALRGPLRLPLPTVPDSTSRSGSILLLLRRHEGWRRRRAQPSALRLCERWLRLHAQRPTWQRCEWRRLRAHSTSGDLLRLHAKSRSNDLRRRT